MDEDGVDTIDTMHDLVLMFERGIRNDPFPSIHPSHGHLFSSFSQLVWLVSCIHLVPSPPFKRRKIPQPLLRI